MARPSGRTNSVKGLVGVAIIRLVGRRAETPLRRGQGKSDLPLLLCRLERFRFGAFSLCWHPDLATVRASLAVFGRASCWGLLFEQDQTKNARHSLPFDDVESLNRKIFRPTVFIRMTSRRHIEEEAFTENVRKSPFWQEIFPKNVRNVRISRRWGG